jgi:hypothetical protein
VETMNLDDYVIDEYDPSHKRQLRRGHSIQKSADGSRLVCACGWFYAFSPLVDREAVEELAWLHVSKPQLIIKGSSDVDTRTGRIRRMGK